MISRKPEIDVQKDGRVILHGMAYLKMKAKLRQLAGNKCERCGRPAPDGDPHHVSGRGGGKRDDRIFVDGDRNLENLCRECHTGKHIPAKVCPPKPTEQEFDSMLGL